MLKYRKFMWFHYPDTCKGLYALCMDTKAKRQAIFLIKRLRREREIHAFYYYLNIFILTHSTQSNRIQSSMIPISKCQTIRFNTQVIHAHLHYVANKANSLFIHSDTFNAECVLLFSFTFCWRNENWKA